MPLGRNHKRRDPPGERGSFRWQETAARRRFCLVVWAVGGFKMSSASRSESAEKADRKTARWPVAIVRSVPKIESFEGRLGVAGAWLRGRQNHAAWDRG